MLYVLLLLLSLALAVLAGGPCLLLAFVCGTHTGLAFAITGFLFSIIPLLLCLAWKRHSVRLWIATTLCIGGSAVLACLLVGGAPDGRTPDNARVQNRYISGVWKFQKYALGNLLPEEDQLSLGSRVMPVVDRLFTVAQGQHLTRLTSAIYNDLEADSQFHALGSVLPAAYDELWGRNFNRGHYFLYIPVRLDRHQPHPALVFLHGSGGNFKAYTWLLSQVADELGLVLIAPSYGMGNWREPDTSHLITDALKDANKVVAIDSKRTHLMGLSNGGLGVSEVGAALGEYFHSLTFISPVFDTEAVSSPGFIKKWKGRPVFIITGREDDRIPFSYVSKVSSQMKSNGIRVVLEPMEAADHFMIFSHRAKVLPILTSWLRESFGEPVPGS